MSRARTLLVMMSAVAVVVVVVAAALAWKLVEVRGEIQRALAGCTCCKDEVPP